MEPRKPHQVVLGFFLRGLLLLAPVVIIGWAVLYVLEWLDGLLGVDIPGLGLVVLLAGVTVVGWMGSTILYQPFAEIGELILRKVPVLKTFYDALKDLMEALVGSKKKFDRPVLVRMGTGTEVEKIGFITQDDLSHLGVESGKVAVYMPHAFNWSGNLCIVPSRNVTPIAGSAGDVMKFVVSGGVSRGDEAPERNTAERSTGLLLALLCSLPLLAQTEARSSSTMFSNGVHPTLSVAYMNTDARSVSDFWKAELKGISMKVSDRKELIGITARIPSISPDTLRILVKAEQPKGLAQVTLHVAILTTSGYIGPDSPERELSAARAYVEERAVALKRQVALSALEGGRKELERLKREHADLQREHLRTEQQIERTKRKAEESALERTRSEELSESLRSTTDSLRSAHTANPTESSADAVKAKERELARTQDRARRAGDAVTNGNKRVADLDWSLKKNLQEQALKEKAVAKQEELVKKLTQDLENVR